MKLIQTIRERLLRDLPKAVLLLFIIQPLMDMLSFWFIVFDLPNFPTLLMRLGVLAVTVLGGFLLAENKKPYYLTAAVCALLGAGHVFAAWQHGYADIVSDLSNYIRVLQLPLTVLCLITCFGIDDSCYAAMKKGIVINVLIILACQVVAILTGTEPHTYDDGSGFIGWFSNTNTQSAILTMAAPAAVTYLFGKYGFKSKWLWITLIGTGFSMFFIGTRLCFAGIIATCFGMGGSMLIIRLKDWKKAIVFFLVGALFVCALPMAPMMGHRSNHANEMKEKQGWLAAALQKPQKDTKPLTGTPPLQGEPLELTVEQRKQIYRLTPVYKHYVSDLCAVFGVEKTIHLMNYTEDITIMTNTRAKKLMVAKALMENSPASARLFGVELSRFTMRNHIFDVENDFHGIYYLYGAVGLAAMLLYVAYFLLLILRALVKDFKGIFTADAAAWGIGLIMCLGHCYATAGVLRRPSASFYMAAILAAVYYLTKMGKKSEKAEV